MKMNYNYTLNDITNPKIIESKSTDLYQYTVYIGTHKIITSTKNSYWYIDTDNVVVCTGDKNVIVSNKVCVEIYGYTPETRTSTFSRGTDLPYINGCSTKQLLEPVRHGDPTWQMLHIPPNTAEQEHHIHSTARVVYILKGKGISHIGTKNNTIDIELLPENVLILDKMTPHHFSTNNESLTVLPLHIYSSTQTEYNHPMYNGTFRI